MERQKGLLNVQDTLGEMTFYPSQDGNIVKEKGCVNATSPAFSTA
jgi:hypothetical protein